MTCPLTTFHQDIWAQHFPNVRGARMKAGAACPLRHCVRMRNSSSFAASSTKLATSKHPAELEFPQPEQWVGYAAQNLPPLPAHLALSAPIWSFLPSAVLLHSHPSPFFLTRAPQSTLSAAGRRLRRKQSEKVACCTKRVRRPTQSIRIVHQGPHGVVYQERARRTLHWEQLGVPPEAATQGTTSCTGAARCAEDGTQSSAGLS